MQFLILLLFLFVWPLDASQTLGKVPIAYKGRFRPYEAYSELSLYHLANKSAMKDLLMLPSKRYGGEWLPLSALEGERNPTRYSNEQFHKLKSAYLHMNQALKDQDFDLADQFTEKLSVELLEAYASIAGTSYQETSGKSLFYPTFGQLKAEYFYYHYPLTTLTIFAYGVVLAVFFWIKRSALLALIPFAMHTIILVLRCYILGRPPVSNMFETVIYVPWVAVLAGFGFYYFNKNRLLLFAAVLSAFLFLVFLQITRLDNGMENVQAVLDSQFWLAVHVLMVVGSYGLFVLAGFLGHIYLGMHKYSGKETAGMQHLAQCLIQTIYIGTALLIGGTILGGVWAAQSWGRFWDWDPKESWAFISCCIYLIWIHLHTFKRIDNFGLAIGSIAGLAAIGFTWYGVNYILGTGLHSYGFGNGGERYFYAFLVGEMVFLSAILGKNSWIRKSFFLVFKSNSRV